jgi:peptidoglycan/LPS O-acetylase OafA/YrhL
MRSQRMGKAFGVLLTFILLSVVAFPWNVAWGIPWRDLFAILIVMPNIVVLAIGHDGAGRVGTIIGNLSFPVYALHYPLILIASGLYQTTFAKVNSHIISICTVLIVLALATISERLYNDSVRRRFALAVSKILPGRFEALSKTQDKIGVS